MDSFKNSDDPLTADFIRRIENNYYESRKLKEGDGGYNIRRGMSHVRSGYIEDVFALYVAKYVKNKNIKYFVDKVISTKFPGDKKATSFKPDLAIIDENNILTHYFDLKTNLGWNRKLEKFLSDKECFMKKLRRKNHAWITKKKEWKNGEWKDLQKIELAISQSLKYHIVVVNTGNINTNLLNENIKRANELEAHIQLDFLKNGNKTCETGFKNINESLNSLKK